MRVAKTSAAARHSSETGCGNHRQSGSFVSALKRDCRSVALDAHCWTNRSPVRIGTMTVHGHVRGGVIVLDEGERLPEGTRVVVIPEVVSDEQPISDTMTPEEHARLLKILDEIAALPIEG